MLCLGWFRWCCRFSVLRLHGGFGLLVKCVCGHDAELFWAGRVECVDCYLWRVKRR